jgi:hypothetical protein
MIWLQGKVPLLRLAALIVHKAASPEQRCHQHEIADMPQEPCCTDRLRIHYCFACVQVRQTAAALRQQLKGAPGLELPSGQQRSIANGSTDGSSSSSSESPLVHLQLTPKLTAAAGSRKKADALLQAIADRLLQKHGLLVAVPRYSNLDRTQPPASIKMYVHAGLSMEQVPTVASAVRESAQHVLGPLL